MEPFIGSEVVAGGGLTRGQLRWGYTALHPDVYLRRGATQDLDVRTRAAWLWTRRRGIVAGRAAAAFYCRPTNPDIPVELIGRVRRRESGVIVRDERIAEDEIVVRRGISVTTPVRTAWDLARHVERREAIIQLDALAAATGISREDVVELSRRYPGARGAAVARASLWDMDGGAGSPEESRIRVILVDHGIPRPETGIVVGSGPEAVRVPMGWPNFRVGLHYRAEPVRPEHAVVEHLIDLRLALAGWLMVTVVPDNFQEQIVAGVRQALMYRAGIRR